MKPTVATSAPTSQLDPNRQMATLEKKCRARSDTFGGLVFRGKGICAQVIEIRTTYE